MKRSDRPKVVIVGAGFGGLWAARALSRFPADVTIVDRNNYHTFLPLLYQVSAAELEPEQIAYPIRSFLRRMPNIGFTMGEVTDVDLEARVLKTTSGNVSYDYLILAPGSVSHYFGVRGAQDYAFPLKTIEEGINLRNHILRCFERASCETDPERRRRMLTFVIVGGGATGVEFAGALAELILGPIMKDYPSLLREEVRVVLVEAGRGLLGGMSSCCGHYAVTHLREKGVEVCLETPVSEITPHAVHLQDGTLIPAETVAWTAGVSADPALERWGLPVGPGGRVKVLPTLQVPGHPEVYVIGDASLFEDDGHALPMVAPVATQQGTAAAENVKRQIQGMDPIPFHYKDRGSMVTVGRSAATAHIGKRGFTGLIAWIIWLTVHLVNLIGFRNRLFVLINWAWDYFLYERAVRIILPNQNRHPVVELTDDAGPIEPAERVS